MQGASKVMIAEVSEKRRNKAKALVPQAEVIDSADKAYMDQVRSITGGSGVDVVITACPAGITHRQGLELLNKNGRMSLFGGLPGENNYHLDSNLIHYKEASVYGAHASTVKQNRTGAGAGGERKTERGKVYYRVRADRCAQGIWQPDRRDGGKSSADSLVPGTQREKPQLTQKFQIGVTIWISMKSLKQLQSRSLAEINKSGSAGAPESKTNYAKYIDHTLLKPDATEAKIKKVCDEAKQYNFASVCVNPTYIEFVAKELKGSPVNPCVVVGFPLGATTPAVKAFETNEVIEKGAKEVDMVLNIGAAKSGNWSLVEEDIKAVVHASRGRALVKVILETCLLTDEEKVKACTISKIAGADFVKTSTGFSTGGATVEDVKAHARDSR